MKRNDDWFDYLDKGSTTEEWERLKKANISQPAGGFLMLKRREGMTWLVAVKKGRRNRKVSRRAARLFFNASMRKRR